MYFIAGHYWYVYTVKIAFKSNLLSTCMAAGFLPIDSKSMALQLDMIVFTNATLQAYYDEYD